MADEKLTEKDDDLDIIEVDEIPSGAAPPKKPDDTAGDKDDKTGAAPEDADDEDDDEEEDARLADDQGGDEDDAKKRRRVKRRQFQKAAKERTLQELQVLRQQNAEFQRRLAAVEGVSIGTSVAQLDQRIAEVQRDIRQADLILAKAIGAGNGDDAAEALRLRDEAKAMEADLARNKAAITARPEAPRGPDPRVAGFIDQWKRANSWYDPSGGDEDSAVVNAIDNRLAAEGYDPATPAYWEELTRRVKSRLSPAAEPAPARDKRRAPPQGAQREHAPQSTRREVYVTPERKAAMVEAGVWDDPAKRAKMLKAYEQYDRDNRSAG